MQRLDYVYSSQLKSSCKRIILRKTTPRYQVPHLIFASWVYHCHKLNLNRSHSFTKDIQCFVIKLTKQKILNVPHTLKNHDKNLVCRRLGQVEIECQIVWCIFILKMSFNFHNLYMFTYYSYFIPFREDMFEKLYLSARESKKPHVNYFIVFQINFYSFNW